jgi:hypothetical protein
MNLRPLLLGLLVATPLATGCASRAAPFDELDQAQLTVLKLTAPTAVAPMPTQPSIGGFPLPPIPGLTPEQQQQLQTGAEQFQQQLQTLIPGLPPLLPTQPGVQQPQQQQQLFNGFAVQGQTPVMDESMKEEILDLLGDEESFNQNRGQCFTPGMAFVFSDPQRGNVEVMISLSCNQAMGNGFMWPHPANGFTPETSQKLRRIYETFWGPAPMQGI